MSTHLSDVLKDCWVHYLGNILSCIKNFALELPFQSVHNMQLFPAICWHINIIFYFVQCFLFGDHSHFIKHTFLTQAYIRIGRMRVAVSLTWPFSTTACCTVQLGEHTQTSISNRAVLFLPRTTQSIFHVGLTHSLWSPFSSINIKSYRLRKLPGCHTGERGYHMLCWGHSRRRRKVKAERVPDFQKLGLQSAKFSPG